MYSKPGAEVRKGIAPDQDFRLLSAVASQSGPAMEVGLILKVSKY